MRKFFKFWLPVLIWAGFIFFVSSLGGEDIPGIFYGQDTIFHLFEYALLALLLNRALTNSRYSSLKKSKRLFLVFISCLVYAISDELHQLFVPARESSIADIVVDSFGIALGSIIYRMKT